MTYTHPITAQDIYGVRRDTAFPSAAMTGALRELAAAVQVLERLGLAAYDQLDGEAMYDLGMAQSLVAGAIKKLEAAGIA